MTESDCNRLKQLLLPNRSRQNREDAESVMEESAQPAYTAVFTPILPFGHIVLEPIADSPISPRWKYSAYRAQKPFLQGFSPCP